MKILLVSTSVVPLGGTKYGGIEGLVTTFARALKATGQYVYVAAPKGSVVPDGVVLIETVSLPEEQDRDDITEGLIHEEDFDIIHDFSHRHVFRDSPKAIHMMWDNITVKYPFKSKKNIITLSDWQKERFRAMYGQQSIVMPMCVDTDIYHPIEWTRDEDHTRFLFLGKISADKGVDIAIKYSRELGVGLDVVGGLIDSELDSPYLKEIEKLCDGEQIKLHFNVDESTKVKFLQNAKALIYPVQMVEAHWLTGIEAWVTGCPTITFNTGSKVEILPDPFWAVENEVEFLNRMYKVDDYEWEWVKDIAVSRYSSKKVIPLYLSLYQNVEKGLSW